jgi:ribA/ribD-fused uncharacterized protein
VFVAEDSILARRPATLSLTWSDRSRQTFPYLDAVARRWDAWLAAHTPTDEQLYRKVLLDLWVVYRASCHQGSSMWSEGEDWAAEFNACTGRPLKSTGDYVERIRPLVSKMMSATDEQLAEAMFTFLVDGSFPDQNDIFDEALWGPRATEDLGPVLFYKVNEPYGFMSNFAPFLIDLDGRRWLTSEHYFQAQKFAGLPQEKKVWAAPTAREAAHLGRTLPGLRSDWDAVKDEVMLKALRAKFTQHPDLRRQLLGTGDRVLVEHTANDSYWADGGDGSGRNRLGELLMQVRAELRG